MVVVFKNLQIIITTKQVSQNSERKLILMKAICERNGIKIINLMDTIFSPFQQEGCVKNQQPHAGSERTKKSKYKEYYRLKNHKCHPKHLFVNLEESHSGRSE